MALCHYKVGKFKNTFQIAKANFSTESKSISTPICASDNFHIIHSRFADDEYFRHVRIIESSRSKVGLIDKRRQEFFHTNAEFIGPNSLACLSDNYKYSISTRYHNMEFTNKYIGNTYRIFNLKLDSNTDVFTIERGSSLKGLWHYGKFENGKFISYKYSDKESSLPTIPQYDPDPDFVVNTDNPKGFLKRIGEILSKL
jgi:hypothetical protein